MQFLIFLSFSRDTLHTTKLNYAILLPHILAINYNASTSIFVSTHCCCVVELFAEHPAQATLTKMGHLPSEMGSEVHSQRRH